MVTPLIDESQKFLIPVDPVNTGSVCVWDYDFPFSLIANVMYLSTGGGGEGGREEGWENSNALGNSS